MEEKTEASWGGGNASAKGIRPAHSSFRPHGLTVPGRSFLPSRPAATGKAVQPPELSPVQLLCSAVVHLWARGLHLTEMRCCPPGAPEPIPVPLQASVSPRTLSRSWMYALTGPACIPALFVPPDLGCDKTRSRVTLQEWNDPLDHDLEAQLIYRHLLGVEAALR